jgi:protoporphyrinogen oxidase
MKKIAIIGGGISGLTLSYKLLKKGFNVTLYEKNDDVSGQLYSISLENKMTDIFYHVTFLSDVNFINLCKELNIYNKLQWLDSSMAYFTNGEMYSFNTPLDMLKFKPLNLIDKIKFGYSILKLRYMKIENVEKYTAKNWFLENGFERVWSVIWEPLFKLKFHNQSDTISLVWLWDKLLKRGKSRGEGKEKFGYMEDSFYILAEALKKEIKTLGGNIILNTDIKEINNDNGKFKILNNTNFDNYDIAISTLSTNNHSELFKFSDKYNKYLSKYKYQSAICALLVVKNKISNYYWTNIGDYDVPFGGLIEHTNLVGNEIYNGKTIIYLSKYLDNDDDFYKKTEEEILKDFYIGLAKINNNFSNSDVLESYIFKEKDAQPIIYNGYQKPDTKTEIKNFYWISTHHVYPHDRGIEYGIEQANNLCDMIVKNDS